MSGLCKKGTYNKPAIGGDSFNLCNFQALIPVLNGGRCRKMDFKEGFPKRYSLGKTRGVFMCGI